MNDETSTHTGARILAIFAGRPASVTYRGKEVLTSIYKEPVTGPVMVRNLNLDGDEQADLTVHGGVDKAVYCYAAEHYEDWKRELQRDLTFGAFGENLTVSGLNEALLHIGDVLQVGDAVLQVSQPRFPCFKLGIKFGDQRFVRRFQKSGRSGFYCRVLQEGIIETGQPISILERNDEALTIARILDEYNKPS
jgi:MOSC domain-containing protein YiiM